jgi:hypothetical protein
MIKTTMKLDANKLQQEIIDYKKYRGCAKYKDDKATVLIALKPPRYTKMCCHSRVPVERSYSDGSGETRTYTIYEKDECPYRVRNQDAKNYSNQYICELFGGAVYYRGYRLDLCKFVFGKSKKMIKSWRPLKEIQVYLRTLSSKKIDYQLDRLYKDDRIGKRQLNKARKVLLGWLSGEAPLDGLDDLITKAIYDPKKTVFHFHMGRACTEGGSMPYGYM